MIRGLPAAQRCSDFSFALPDTPGALARFAAQLRTADVNLYGVWGYGGDAGLAEGLARFYCVPEDDDQFRNFADSAGLTCEEGTTFFIGGDDQPGALARTLEIIGNGGINLIAIQAIVAGRRFGCFVWASPGDWPALAELLSLET